MGTIHSLKHGNAVKRAEKQSWDGFVAPEDLHAVLSATETRAITFKNEKALKSYRAMIYSINKQGDFRYRTMRDENSMWGIVVWRMR